MKFIKTILLFSLLASISLVPAHAKEDPVVLFETSAGNFEVTLNPGKAPITVKNFLTLVDQKHYNGTIFHRVIKNFMIQGGGLDTSMKKIGGVLPIRNEADNGLKNLKGTIAMARTSDPHSATDQFFINTKDNNSLNHTGKNMRGWGYTVFGKVTSGMDVVMKIENSDTDTRKGRRDVPVKTVEILKVTRKVELAPAR
ncbi:MAG TPA: peptidyl-prolyl cis-trans isomerase [Gammaproteobacteria bacterium]|nr:peptidyl-prolyl cis-trans isomerase cyp18 [bacterium BMS3Abin11]GMT41518.1 MAG: peptidyl-prolyl cis-trans isomerase B [bacterium]HDH16284.1 peptidyl-prolyl cis-trans isomerase [Gammaproteobacteria bacterium]